MGMAAVEEGAVQVESEADCDKEAMAVKGASAVKETVAKAGWGEEMAVVALVEAGLGVTVG